MVNKQLKFIKRMDSQMSLSNFGEDTSWKIMMPNICLKDGEQTIRLKDNLENKVYLLKLIRFHGEPKSKIRLTLYKIIKDNKLKKFMSELKFLLFYILINLIEYLI